MEIFLKTTIWRCMNSQVYACNFGANLPCESKANTDKTPTPAMEDYCKANQDSDFIPMSVTGHDTHLQLALRQKFPRGIWTRSIKWMPAGYLASIWYPISPNPNTQPEVSSYVKHRYAAHHQQVSP